MVRIGAPDDISSFYMTDNNEIIFRLHQAGFHPMWRDYEVVYFKKTNKLVKLLKKLGIEID